MVGRLDGLAVGYPFGSPREHHGVAWDDLPSTYPKFDLPAGPVPMYLFREFAVHPDNQRQGKNNVAAQAACQSWGWVQLGEKQPMPDSPVLDPAGAEPADQSGKLVIGVPR